jgi:hypothetical protein
VATTTFIPDPFINWCVRWSIRTIAALLAIGIIAFIASLVFRAIASMIEAIHEVLHQVVLFCTSVNHTFVASGLVGQAVIICLALFCLGWFAYRGYQFFRGGRHEAI